MLHRTLALLLLTAASACKENPPHVKTSGKKNAPVAATAKAPAAAAPSLSSRLDSVALPPLKFTELKIAEAASLWRDTLIQVDPAFAQLGLLLPLEDGPSLSLEIPAGSAGKSLATLLQFYACDSRKGPAHVSIQKAGSAFAEDGPWIACRYGLPCGFIDLISDKVFCACDCTPELSDKERQELMLKFLKKQGCHLAPGFVLEFQNWGGSLLFLGQEADQAKLQQILKREVYPTGTRIDSVWLRAPAPFPAATEVDLAKLLVDPALRVLSHQQGLAQSGQTQMLNFKIQPVVALGAKEISDASATSPSFWVDTVQDQEEFEPSSGDTLLITPTVDPDGKHLDLEIKHKLSWSLEDPSRQQAFIAENKVKLSSGETRILSQERESDGKHWRIHLVRPEVSTTYASPTRMEPLSNHQILGADAALLAQLQAPVPTADRGSLDKALRAWAAAVKIALKESGEAISPPFGSCGPLSAAVILQELSFRSQMQASWKDGALELRWPQKNRNYRLGERPPTVYEILPNESYAGLSPQEILDKEWEAFLNGPLWKSSKSVRGYGAQNLAMSFTSPHVEPYFRCFLNSILSEPINGGSIHVEVMEIPASELARLSSSSSSDAELLAALKSAASAKTLRSLEGAMLSGSTGIFLADISQVLPQNWKKPVLMDPGSGAFLAPQPVPGDRTKLGWQLEFTSMIDPDGQTVETEIKISETALVGQEKLKLQAQVGNKPVQSFPIEVPVLRQHRLETKVESRFGQTILIGRSSVPAEKPGEIASRERLFFLRLEPQRQKPKHEALP